MVQNTGATTPSLKFSASDSVPARLAGVLVALAGAAAPQSSGVAALRIMLRDAGKHRSPNAGWPESAMAGALGIALAGPRRYAERVVDDPWLGDGRARVTPVDMHRALLVYAVACALQGAAILALYLLLPEASPHVPASGVRITV